MTTPTFSEDLQRVGDVPVTDAATAAASVNDDATLLVSGFGSVGDPKAVPLEIAKAAEAGERDPELTVVSGGSVGDPIDTALIQADAVARRYPYQARSAARTAVDDRSVAFADRGIAGLSDEVRFGRLVDPDIAVVEAVAVGHDWLVPSTSLGQTPGYVAAADELVVEVNAAQPVALGQFHDVYLTDAPPNRDPIPLSAPGDRIGDPFVRFDSEKLRAVVQTNEPDDPYKFREPTAADRAIADNVVQFLRTEADRDPVVADAPTLQFGVGSLGNALMGALADTELLNGDGPPLRYFGEVIQDGLLDILDTGRLAAASATSLALSADGQERLFAEPERYADRIVLRPSAVSNAPALIDRTGVVAINTAVAVDIYGHVNSTHLNATHVLNGVGGSVDFLRNAHCSIVATPATAADGDVSTVVPMVSHVDHTEHDIDVVVTEHGVADLRGCSPVERAERILRIADPAFRPDLRRYLDHARTSGGHVPHDLDRAFDWQR
ncbi:acetyl-CoA hydrolase/transferase C-terminal domain-containing protein [Halobaculum sp. MBLA0147]|uniref:acetyl-CoA hydrolase/transferase C-terminal domain-containing protein n=1 Tax=Halobaculum sp. MBLA0147 TaxID=3079934 RepID=UPI00352331F7